MLPDIGNANACISMDTSKSKVRVWLPADQIDTFFASVIGVETIDVTAAATAEAKMTRGDRVIPATITAANGTGNL